jgi:hypothetical protein
MVRGDAFRHPLLDRLEVGRRQRPRQLEVVVEAVGDRRTNTQLRVRKQVHDGLSHDVGGRVTHRVELAVRAGIQELVRRAPLGRLELLFGLLGRVTLTHRALCRCLLRHFFRHLNLPRNTTPLVHRQDERCSLAVPPAFTTAVGRALVPR